MCVGGGGKQDMGVEEDWGLYPGWVGRHRRALCRGGMESDQVITEALGIFGIGGTVGAGSLLGDQ